MGSTHADGLQRIPKRETHLETTDGPRGGDAAVEARRRGGDAATRRLGVGFSLRAGELPATMRGFHPETTDAGRGRREEKSQAAGTPLGGRPLAAANIGARGYCGPATSSLPNLGRSGSRIGSPRTHPTSCCTRLVAEARSNARSARDLPQRGVTELLWQPSGRSRGRSGCASKRSGGQRVRGRDAACRGSVEGVEAPHAGGGVQVVAHLQVADGTTRRLPGSSGRWPFLVFRETRRAL